MALPAVVPSIRYTVTMPGIPSVVCRIDKTNASLWTFYYPLHSKLSARLANNPSDSTQATLTTNLRAQFNLAKGFTINFVGM